MAYLEITTIIGCKINCLYCPQAKLIAAYKKRSKDILMSLDTFKRCLARIPREVGIVFAGFSEPWLNPDCTRMVLHAHENGHGIGIHTTLTGMNEADVDILKTIPFRKDLSIHLPSDHPPDKKHERIVVDKQYLAVLEKLVQSGIPAKYHVHTATAHPEVLERMQGTEISYWRLVERAGNLTISENPTPPKRGILRCEVRMWNPIVLPNGEVSLCCQDYGLQHIIGNLLTGDYETLFKSPEFLRIQSGLRDSTADILCRQCEYALDADFWARLHNTRLPAFVRKWKAWTRSGTHKPR